MSYKQKILNVQEGGSNRASSTAYAPICGGTTSTGTLQSVASVGTSGQILISNGTSSLPTFQTVSSSGSGAVIFVRGTAGNPADATTYFIETGTSITTNTTSGARSRLYLPFAATITRCYAFQTIAGTIGSVGQISNFYIRKNNTTDTLVNGISSASASTTASNFSLSISCVAGDYIEFKILTPTWAVNPTSVSFSATLFMA